MDAGEHHHRPYQAPAVRFSDIAARFWNGSNMVGVRTTRKSLDALWFNAAAHDRE
jgi:hypothetical protein